MNRIDLSGKVFGRYTVLSFSGCGSSHAFWMCRCSCGKEKPVDGGALRSGQSTQCSDCAAKSRGMARRKPVNVEYRKKKQQECTVKLRFNLTPTQHVNLLHKQNNRCAICNVVLGYRAAIDHDKKCCPDNGHSCGKCIRGVLCMQCNVGLGNFKDDAALLLQAILYLLEKRKNA
jgi:hypothetical protein